MGTVLVIDDVPSVVGAIEVLLNLHDISTRGASSPEEGLALLAREPIDLVIADMNFTADTTSGEEGIALFDLIRARYPQLPVVLLTAWGRVESAVRLVKSGAADYLCKPWDNKKLLATVQSLLALSQSQRERQELQAARHQRRAQLQQQHDLCGLVFESEAMAATVELACRVARSTVPVLITGPNGTGKERIAAILHANSPARQGPFVAVNCGALPPELMEAELFGAEAGAFTGAQRARPGRFELAQGGTLFLDEVGNLPPSGQVKLLRVLESGDYVPLGAGKPRMASARILSATNADLPALIREGRFREDLYYRLNAIEICVPPLTERTQDILPLAEHFLGTRDLRLSEDAREALLQHRWPGNVRELRNVIERAKLLCSGSLVTPSDLGLAGTLSRTVAERETPRSPEAHEPSREEIESCLRLTMGNISRAAHSLGLSRQALYRRMQRFGIRLAHGE